MGVIEPHNVRVIGKIDQITRVVDLFHIVLTSNALL